MPYVVRPPLLRSGTAEALALYRESFRPSPELTEPRTFLTVNVVVAETEDEAARLALPQLQAMLALRDRSGAARSGWSRRRRRSSCPGPPGPGGEDGPSAG